MTSLLIATAVAAAVSAYADTVVDVRPDAKLWLRNLRGSVQVSTWGKNAVRIQVPSWTRARLRIAQRAGALSIEPEYGHPHSMEAARYVITVPTWMGVALVSPEASARVRGLKGDLIVRTVNGEVEVTDNQGSVSVSSVQGPIRVTHARGRLDLSTVNGPITLDDVTGSVNAETVNGPIELARVIADSVEASTLNGFVRFDGHFLNRGWYHFATHNGDIAVDLPKEPDAQVFVATYGGQFSSDFPVSAPRSRHGRGLHFTLGDGKAMLQLESFTGRIRLLREAGGRRTPQTPPVFEWREFGQVNNPPNPPNASDDDHEEDK